MFFPSSVGGNDDLQLALYGLTWTMYPWWTSVKYQCVILMYDPLSQKCIWLCPRVLTGRTVLRAFWESASRLIILSLVQIKIPFFLLSSINYQVFFLTWQLIECSSQSIVRKILLWGWAISTTGIGTTAMGFCIGWERLGCTPNTGWSGNL